MTTIFLVIMGVILAAAAVLFVVYSGGDAFGNGHIEAEAGRLVGEGAQMEAALELYYRQEGSYPTSDDPVEDLIDAGYLDFQPLGTRTTETDRWAIDYEAGMIRARLGDTDHEESASICLKARQQLDLPEANTSTGIYRCDGSDSPAGKIAGREPCCIGEVSIGGGPVEVGGPPETPPAPPESTYWRIYVERSEHGQQWLGLSEFTLYDAGGSRITPIGMTASSVYAAEWSPEKGSDGNTGTYWSSATNQDNGAWLALELPEAARPTDIGIRVWEPGMGPVWFRFQRSDDGINWTNVGSSRAENSWAANQLRSYNIAGNDTPDDPPEDHALFWRMRIVSGGSYVGLNEVHALDAQGNRIPFAGATASSQYSSAYRVEYAIDLRGSTYWSTAGATAGQWISFQFPEPEKPFSFQIVANRSSYGPSRLYFEKSRDGVTWERATQDIDPNWSASTTQVFPMP